MSGALTVVGVGASAGGLEAFSQILRACSEAKHVAIVFVQHLSPHHESALVSLLTVQTPLTVVQAEEGMRVEAGHVYVIPPNVQMEMRGAELHLSPRPADRSRHTPIDAFLVSLAEAAQERSVAVILSGTASDGAIGLADVKRAGGLTFAQSPESAKYDGMPRAAIDTGMVDLVLSPAAIGAKLAELGVRGRVPATTFADDHDVAPDNLQRIYDVLRPVSGVDFRHYKLPTIKRRLFRRMALHRINDVGDYIQLLESNANEARSLYQDLLIHVTRFFRDPDSFVGLAAHVFPAILEGRPADQPIRVWVSGCATGEEAYSVAIALIEFLQKDHPDTRVQIFATDVSESAIEFARAGVYPASIEADVSDERRRLYFTRVDGGYRVAKMVRDLCVFARQDLTKDPPFSHLDLILCRNVLIYMDTQLQRKLLSVFHYALNPGGFLVLGQAESVGAQGTLFSARRQEAAHPPQEGRPDCADDDVPGRSRVRRPAARPGARRRRIADREGAPGRGEPRHPRSVCAAGRGGRRRPADRPVPRPDRGVPRAGAGRGQPQPAEDGARGAALRPPHDAAGGAQEPGGGAQDRPAGTVGDALAAGDAGRDPAHHGGTAALPRAVRWPCAADGGAARPRRGGADAGPAARPRGPPRRAAAAARAGGQPRVPAVDHPGARSRQRGAAVGQRGDPVEQRGAAVAPTRSSTRRRRSCSRPTRS